MSTLYTTAEVATRLGVTSRTIRRYIDAGDIAAIRLPGGHLRIPATEIDRLLAAPAEAAS